MNQFLSRLTLSAALLLCANFCFSQSLEEIVNHQLKNDPRDKIYIHYDKTNYVTGDTIWFKAYLFSGTRKYKGGKNFYLELVNDRGRVVNRLIAPILESTASGNIVIPADSSMTALYCRAYTATTLKGDYNFIYNKVLPVLNLKKDGARNMPINTIGFYPEGGEWVENLPALIAFKVTDRNGFPVSATGVIKDGEETVAEFATTHDGMGTISLTAKPNNTYFAVWKDANGETTNSKFLTAKPNGIYLHISDVDAGKKFYIFRSKHVDDADKDLTLLAYANSEIVYQAKLNMSATEMVNGIVPVKELPSGILQITVFNRDNKPLAERLTFVNNHDYAFGADVEMATLSKAKRSKNEIKLALKDTSRANFSLSVTDAEFDQPSGLRDNVISGLLLTGDLRGKIANPYYYFKNNTPEAASNLDLVMLTHGWRKYNWSADTTSKLPSDTVKDYSFLSIKGKVKNPPSGLADSYVTAIMQTGDTSNIMLPLNVNKEGYFFRDGLIYYGDAKMYFKFANKSLAANSIKIEAGNGLIKSFTNFPFVPSPDTLAPTANSTALLARVEDYLAQLRSTRALKEVLIKSAKVSETRKLENTYTSGVFKDGIATIMKVGNDPRFLNYASFFQYLQGKVPGLRISNPLSDPLTTSSAIWRNERVSFFLNGFQVNVNDVLNTAMQDFDYVKIYDPSAGAAFGAPGGVISVYTKRDKGFVFDGNNNKMLIIPGYTVVKEFFSPDYASGIMVSKPDLRTTLYWNPNIILDKATPQQVIKFYNNDVTRKFKIVLQGMNAEGKLVYMEKVL